MKRLASSVLIGLGALGALGQSEQARPRLVVGIVVDQLRTDYIEYLQSYFGERGFKFLLNSGAYMRDVDFGVPRLDAVNSTGMLYTGGYPYETGVPSSSVVADDGSGTLVLPLATSGKTMTNDSFTAEPLRLSTIADELAIDNDGSGTIYSVAVDPQQAVIMSGHAGDGAYWINNTSGNWATTSYYGPMPSVISGRNMRGSLSQRIDTMQWRGSSQLGEIAGIKEKRGKLQFRHTFSKSDRDVYKKFGASALANAEVTDVAIALLNSMSFQGDGTDMLNIGYTLAPYKYGTDNGRAELTDSYLRLDGQLARLFDAIDRKVGHGNALIWVSSTGYYDEGTLPDGRYRIPGGEFSAKRAKSLLNSYLSAKHGSAGYVTAIRDGQVYFDRHAIESMRLDTDEIVADARSFLVKMSGVTDAVTQREIETRPEYEPLRLAVDPRTGGEIIIRFTPGWTVAYDEQSPVVYKNIRESAVMTPAFITGPGIEVQTIDTPVSATALAPTVTGALHIRSPNGARSRGIALKK